MYEWRFSSWQSTWGSKSSFNYIYMKNSYFLFILEFYFAITYYLLYQNWHNWTFLRILPLCVLRGRGVKTCQNGIQLTPGQKRTKTPSKHHHQLQPELYPGHSPQKFNKYCINITRGNWDVNTYYLPLVKIFCYNGNQYFSI